MRASKPAGQALLDTPGCQARHVGVRAPRLCADHPAGATILLCVSSLVIALVRRGLAAGAALTTALVLAVLAAAPAAAEVPEGWSNPEPVDPLYVILVAAGLPILMVLVLVAFVYGPPLARGERIAPGAPEVENQWIGGPRKAAGELAGPDGDDSEAGGASGRW